LADKTDSPSEISADSDSRNGANSPKTGHASVPEVSLTTRRVGLERMYSNLDMAHAKRAEFLAGVRWAEQQLVPEYGIVASVAIREARERHPLPPLVAEVGPWEFTAHEGKVEWRNAPAGSPWHRLDSFSFCRLDTAEMLTVARAIVAVLEDRQ
jgi:hypothetical protein